MICVPNMWERENAQFAHKNEVKSANPTIKALRASDARDRKRGLQLFNKIQYSKLLIWNISQRFVFLASDTCQSLSILKVFVRVSASVFSTQMTHCIKWIWWWKIRLELGWEEVLIELFFHSNIKNTIFFCWWCWCWCRFVISVCTLNFYSIIYK